MVNHLLLNFVNRELGSGKETARDNYAYHCPFCNHRKPKLEIKMGESSNGENKWNCWSCGTKGKTAFQLFRKLKVSNEKLEELKTIVKETKTYQGKDNYYDKEKIELPKEFISLKNPNLKDIETKHVLSYLKKRGIEHSDIVKYNIGFCEEGKYEGRIIFPIYDEFNNLVFFDSRTYKDHSLRYLKPSYPKDFFD